MTTRYVEAFRIPQSVGAGRVLMHNHIRHTINHPNGINGFRAWTDSKRPPGFQSCRCGWSGLPHYARGAFKCDTPAKIKQLTGVYIPRDAKRKAA